MRFVEQYVLQLNTAKRRWRRAVTILTTLSLIVALVTVWNLRMTGLTIANSASCGYQEHQHTAQCEPKLVLSCENEVPETPADETTPATEPTIGATEPVETQPGEPVETTEPDEETQPGEPIVIINPGQPSIPVEQNTTQSTDTDTTPSQGEDTSDSGHTHTDACYTTVYSCGQEEHIHQIACYSDPSADVETPEIWEATIPVLTDNPGEDLILIAQSQLGNRESENNYVLAEDGVSKCGITRYGQWYGNPYGEWSNMFTSFCLRYAGFPEDLLNSGAEVMRRNWEKKLLYRSADIYTPVAGDIVFLNKNENNTVDATAIILSLENDVLTVIEGDVENAVAQVEYPIDSRMIVGYGITEPGKRMMVITDITVMGSVVGNTVDYTEHLLTQEESFLIYTTSEDGKHYAMDGDGNAVEIQINTFGAIHANVSDQDILYWEFEKTDNYDGKPVYYIKNVSTGKYLYPYLDNASTYGVVHTGKWGTAVHPCQGGVKLWGINQAQYAQQTEDTFNIVDDPNSASVFSFGRAASEVTLWLDGTNGNLMSYRGSDNTKYTVYTGTPSQLPSQWKSPTKYSYKLAGWVNVKTGDYYLPGAEITVTENTVLYADWVASTYDIGYYNSYVANTVSTNDFITTYVFDYSSLINLLSSKVTVNVSGSSHSESWSHVASGAVSFKDRQTLNFSFNDHDGSGSLTNLNSLNSSNKYTGGTAVYSGIYNAQLGEALFGTNNLFDPETGEGIVGKHYLGQGDHLFQINTDPTSEHYGYYYYDAKRNAVSYNQSDQRFYVYNYLARTSDSANNNDAGKYSDFLPLNSPYANTNGQTIKTYNYAGDDGEYSGVSHYVYDARYNSDGSATNQVHANLWFGMRVDVQFGLSDIPGQQLPNGAYGNKDLYGKDMHFEFTGDDDVWILVDGKVVLDLGGIHQAAEGDINFSTGEVRVNGKSTGTLSGIGPGEHTLTILYLERGSSMSNCAIYFNLAPRFSLTLEKEDVLTQETLNGAQFALYNDLACTDPCALWTSQQSYKNGDAPTNVFTIENGQAYIWGFSPSRTYYLKEIAPPDAEGYSPATGVIQLILDKNGLNSYSATILEGVDENGNKIPISHGFTLHGFRIDEEKQAAYIKITNAQNWVTETTSVFVEKKWNDTKDHTHDAVTVYLNVTDPDGTVRRIREIRLSEENDWKYTWTNLPMYAQDPETGQESDIPVAYSVSEAYVSGYTHSVEVLENGTFTEEVWAESASFKNGEKYILKTSSGYLSTVAADQKTLCFVDEATAKSSPLALWTATVSSGVVKLTNQEGQSINYYSSGNTKYFNATTDSARSQNLTVSQKNGGIRLGYKSGTRTYYLCGLNRNSYADAKTDSNSALLFYPMVKTVTTTTVKLEGYGFTITNTPLTSETSVKVIKNWNHPMGDVSAYEKSQVTLRLYANGVDTGRTETVSLKNNWTVVFSGLPYMDDQGTPIRYTVVETWENDDWIPTYGEVIATNDSIPTYSITVTNTYRWTGSYELPGTGGVGNIIYILCGLTLVSGPLVYGFSLKRRYERRSRG